MANRDWRVMIEGRARKFLLPVSCDGMKRQVVVARDQSARWATSKSRMLLPLRPPRAATSSDAARSPPTAGIFPGCKTRVAKTRAARGPGAIVVKRQFGASAPIPKFASLAAHSDANFGIKRGTSNFMILVRVLNLKFLHEAFRTNDRNFKFTALDVVRVPR